MKFSPISPPLLEETHVEYQIRASYNRNFERDEQRYDNGAELWSEFMRPVVLLGWRF